MCWRKPLPEFDHTVWIGKDEEELYKHAAKIKIKIRIYENNINDPPSPGKIRDRFNFECDRIGTITKFLGVF